MDFGRAVRTLRALRGMTQHELADLAETSRMVIWQIENGFTPPDDLRAAIRRALSWTEREDAALEMLAGERVAAAQPEAA